MLEGARTLAAPSSISTEGPGTPGTPSADVNVTQSVEKAIPKMRKPPKLQTALSVPRLTRRRRAQRRQARSYPSALIGNRTRKTFLICLWGLVALLLIILIPAGVL